MRSNRCRSLQRTKRKQSPRNSSNRRCFGSLRRGALDAEAIAPPAAAGLTESVTVSDQPVLDEAHIEAGEPAEFRATSPSAGLSEAAPASKSKLPPRPKSKLGRLRLLRPHPQRSQSRSSPPAL